MNLLRDLWNWSQRVRRVGGTRAWADDAPSENGYEDPELVEVVFQKTLRLRDSSTPTLDAATCRMALGLLSHPRVVLDVGGACGATYFRLRRLLDREVEWHVLETSVMAARGHALSDGSLHFHDEMPDIQPDVILASGVLQYMPDPIAGLATILARHPHTIVLTRTALAEHPTSIVQRTRLADNGPGPLPGGFVDREVAYVLRAAARAEVEQMLSAEYELTALDEGDGVTGSPSPRISTYGWLGISKRSL
jgi:putative methyltransferase (TIGR04325 family)